MSTDKETISRQECTEEVRTMARVLAELHFFYAKAIIDKYGDEGKQLVHQVIKEFGSYRGAQVREKIAAMGLPLTPENYRKVPDLPRIGWESELVESSPRCRHSKVYYCPLAAVWKELGAERMGFIYCEVDPAKYAAYNPAMKFTRETSLLTGGPCCDMAVRLEE